MKKLCLITARDHIPASPEDLNVNNPVQVSEANAARGAKIYQPHLNCVAVQ
jgi:hypothetical protein